MLCKKCKKKFQKSQSSATYAEPSRSVNDQSRSEAMVKEPYIKTATASGLPSIPSDGTKRTESYPGRSAKKEALPPKLMP
jgi:hypothetical protein